MAIEIMAGLGQTITQTRLFNILQYIMAVNKNGCIQMKNCDSFLIFAQNIDCGYTLEDPQSIF